MDRLHMHNPVWVKDMLTKESWGSKGMDGGKACHCHVWSKSPDTALVQELGGDGNKCKPSLRYEVQMDALKAQLQENNGWKMLSIEETLMRLERIAEPLSVESFICILQKCRKKKILAHAKSVHRHICNNGLEGHRVLGNYLVPMFTECGSLSDAQQVFDTLVHRNEYAWTSLIQGYMESGELWHALKLFGNMQENGIHPSAHTFVAVLKACARLKCIERGREIHTEIAKEGTERAPFVGNTLVDMYAKCGSLAEAQELFDKLPIRDIVLWNALIAGNVEHRLGEEALNCLEQMHLEGVSPNAVTFVCSLKACGSIGAVDRGRKLHAEITKEGFERDLFVTNTLMHMYVKCGSLAEAQDVFDVLLVRDTVSWNALIAGYAEHGLGEEVLTCLEQMQVEGVSPNAVTLACGLKAFGSMGAIDRVREIHGEIATQGFEKYSFVSNSLVHMYAKCNSVAEAQHVFGELPVQDIVSWTSLIAGYVEHGLNEEALKCLEQMQVDDMSPNAVTFVCSLKACSSIGAMDRGREIHAEIVKEGFEKESFVLSTLVDLYAKCGPLAEVWEMFDELPVRDVALWNALLAGCVEHGLGDKALNCLEQMRLEGVSPNALTFVNGLKACGNIGAIDSGQEIYAEIAKEGFERDPFVSNALVHMYAKCGSLAEAQELVEESLVQDVVSWNALIAGYAEHGHGEDALNCVEQMQLEGVFLNAVTFVCSLKACGSVGATDRCLGIHAETVKEEFERDLSVGNALLEMYVKCGLFAEAQAVFDELSVQNVVSWTVLIAGYADYGFGEEALDCMEQMRLEGMSPDVVTLVCCLKACGSIKAIDRGREIHADLSKEGFERDPFVGNTLVHMYAKCGSLAEAKEVFDDLNIRDVVSWTALIAGYTEQVLCEEALICLEQMQLEGASPNAVTFVCGLKACGSIGAIDRGRVIHAGIVKEGFERDLVVASTLVHMYSKCGSIAEADQVFDKLPVQDVVSWNALIAAYAELGLSEEALYCLEEMQMDGVSPDEVSWTYVILGFAEQGESGKAVEFCTKMQEQGLTPASVTFLSILKACGNTAALETGKKIHAQIQRVGQLEITEVFLATALMDMYGKCGSMVDAQQVFDAMPTRDIVAWNTLIAGYARQGDIEIVSRLFERVREECLQPDEMTFLNVLNVCNHSGFVDKGQKYFDDMSKQYGIGPTIEHHNSMIDLLGRAGQLNEAVAMLEEMSSQPDLVVWMTVLGACQKWNNVELGREAFKCAVQLDENYAAAYIMMSNIYADAHVEGCESD